METTNLSESLNSNDIYYVCHTGHESIDNFHGHLYSLRKSFFENSKKSLSVNEKDEQYGCNIKFKGKISKHNISWKKRVNKVITEEAFLVLGAYAILMRNFNGNVIGKVWFDKDMNWTKTEYFSADNYTVASTILKPVPTSSSMELFICDFEKKNYSHTLLYPVPYNLYTAEQTIVEQNGDDGLILTSTDAGDFRFCNEKLQKKILEEVKSAKIENLETALDNFDCEKDVEPVSSIDTEVEFTNLETAPIVMEKSKKEEIVPVEEISLVEEVAPTEENAPVEEVAPIEESTPVEMTESSVSPVVVDESIGTIHSEDLTLLVETTKKEQELDIYKNSIINVNEKDKFLYTGSMFDGQRHGRGRTDQSNGLTAYVGEYKENHKDGFGSSYYKNGDLSYSGNWKNDKKDGTGVSFRKKDHSVQVCNWENGVPSQRVTLFNENGNIKHTGKIINGQKCGFGMTYLEECDCYFVGKWSNGVQLETGTIFDKEGNLIYQGGWKDGKRNGVGQEFDKDGNMVYSGQWLDDNYIDGVIIKKVRKTK